MKKVGPPGNSMNPECPLAQKTPPPPQKKKKKKKKMGGGGRKDGIYIPSSMYEKLVKQQRIIK